MALTIIRIIPYSLLELINFKILLKNRISQHHACAERYGATNHNPIYSLFIQELITGFFGFDPRVIR